jgi:hypothetical protein
MATVTIDIKVGSTFKLSGAYTEDDGTTVIDISGYTEIDVDITSADGTALVNATIGSGVTVDDGANGLWSTDSYATDAWPIELIPFDIKYTDSSGFTTATATAYLNVLDGHSQ